MTLKPSIESAKGAGTVLSSSEYNTNVIQSDNYLQEVISGVNADKIPGSAIANPLTLGVVSLASGTTVAGSFQVNSGLTVVGTSALQGGATVTSGLTVVSGTTAVQALTATTGSFSGTLGVSGASSLATLSTNGALSFAGLTVLTSGTVLANTGSTISAVPASPAGAFEITINGSIAAKVPYYV